MNLQGMTVMLHLVVNQNVPLRLLERSDGSKVRENYKQIWKSSRNLVVKCMPEKI